MARLQGHEKKAVAEPQRDLLVLKMLMPRLSLARHGARLISGLSPESRTGASFGFLLRIGTYGLRGRGTRLGFPYLDIRLLGRRSHG